jgi:hypothetical protein
MEDSIANVNQSSTSTCCKSKFEYLRSRELLKFISNATIPLMIGVIILSIAIHQQNVAQSNRDIDAVQAAKLRSQDLEQGRLKREEDKKIARLQRAEDQLFQENELAEKQRNLSISQRTHELQIVY